MATGNAANANSTGIAVYNGTGTWTGVTITAGNAGVSISNGNGTGGNPTISVVGGGVPWTDATGATQTLATNNGYVTDRGGGVAYTLPSTANLGDIMYVVGKSGAWTIAQNANQQITLGSSSSTIGVGGSIASTNAGDCVTMVCITAGASTVWRVIASMGNITVV